MQIKWEVGFASLMVLPINRGVFSYQWSALSRLSKSHKRGFNRFCAIKMPDYVSSLPEYSKTCHTGIQGYISHVYSYVYQLINCFSTRPIISQPPTTSEYVSPIYSNQKRQPSGCLFGFNAGQICPNTPPTCQNTQKPTTALVEPARDPMFTSSIS